MIIENTHLQTILKETDWTIKGHSIIKSFKFESFGEAVNFLDNVAELAERYEHQPDAEITNNRVKLILSTKDEGGVTDKDVSLATAIDDKLS